MGLYLCIFNEDEEEIDGLDVGEYKYFNLFRTKVLEIVENNKYTSVCPVLMGHMDCAGVWVPEECKILLEELSLIKIKFLKCSPDQKIIDYKKEIIEKFRIKTDNLYSCFVEPNGENIIERLQDLCSKAIEYDLDIMFQ